MAHNRHSHNLIKLIRRLFPQQVITGAEIGVWKGHNAALLLEAFPLLTLYCVDPWDNGGDHVTLPDTTSGEFAAARAEHHRLTDRFLERCITMPTTSVKASESIKNDNLDFVFIDGDHTYESVTQDLGLWFPKARPGGLVSGHDYFWAEVGTGKMVVRQAVDEFFDGNKNMIYEDKVETVPGQVWWFRKRESCQR